MAIPKPRVKLPKTASKNEIVTIKSLISHDMESGQRKDGSGKFFSLSVRPKEDKGESRQAGKPSSPPVDDFEDPEIPF